MNDVTEGLGPMLPCVACKTCRAWWPWLIGMRAPECGHGWPERYATGDGGRRAVMAKGYTEGGTLAPTLF